MTETISPPVYENITPSDGCDAKFFPTPSNETEMCWLLENMAGSSRCWLWSGARSTNGYGNISLSGADKRTVVAHRWAYEMSHGALPSDIHLHHVCFNRQCVNPSHLEQVTQMENNQKSGKLTVERVLEIRSSSESGYSLAKRFGVTPNTISSVRQRRTWKNV